VDTNKDIVYRLRARENPLAQGYFMCDEGRYGYHFANSGDRLLRPQVKRDGRFQPAPWAQVTPLLKQDLAAAVAANARGVVAVLSPFLTVEEAYLLGTYFKGLSADVRLALGPVPVVGEDDRYPKDVKGNPVEPTKFVIRAEKCPNRKGVEAVLRHLQGTVIPFADVARESLDAVWFAGGYPEANYAEGGIPSDWKAPALLVAQDLFPSLVTAAAKYVLPGTASFEKEGTFVNHAGLAQSFGRATRPPVEARTELQLGYDLLGRRGLAQAAAVRSEVAAAVGYFAPLGGEVPKNGVKLGE
jgi:NADH-quinone oxidoreductase subunit G